MKRSSLAGLFRTALAFRLGFVVLFAIAFLVRQCSCQ